jgi:putative membrane protein
MRAELSDSTKLAVDRTRLAYERTLMAWVRTSVSLISFGFTAYKFLQYVRESSKGSHPERIFGARDFALLMIVMGLLSMVVATWQHRRDLQSLRARYGLELPDSLAAALAVLVSAFGFLVLVVVLFRQ